MEEVLRLWGKADLCNAKYDMDMVYESSEEQYMILSDIDSPRTLKMEYGGILLLHREVDESTWREDLKSHFERYGKRFIQRHTFFEVEGSPLSREIARLSGGSLSEGDLLHLKLITGNFIADMVLAGEPTLEPVAEPGDEEGTEEAR